MCLSVTLLGSCLPPSPPSVSHSGKKCWHSCQCSPSQTEKSGLRTHSVRNLERSLAAYQGGRGWQYSWRPKLKACPTNTHPPLLAAALLIQTSSCIHHRPAVATLHCHWFWAMSCKTAVDWMLRQYSHVSCQLVCPKPVSLYLLHNQENL